MISSNAIEYVTRDLFKGKSLKAACNRFIKKFGGQAAVFLGTIDYTAKELAQAVLADKARHITVIENLPYVAERFNLSIPELKEAYDKLKGGSNVQSN